MNFKRLLLVLPLITVATSCKNKGPAGPVDIFAKAREISVDTRAAILSTYGGYTYDTDLEHISSAFVKVSYCNQIVISEGAEPCPSISVTPDGTYKYVFVDGLDYGYATFEDGSWDGEAPHGGTLEELYNTLYDLAFLWSGRVDSANIYSFKGGDSALSDGISRKAKISGSIESGTVRFATDGVVTFSSKNLEYKVTKFDMAYSNYLLTHAVLNYEYYAEGEGGVLKVEQGYEIYLEHVIL